MMRNSVQPFGMPEDAADRLLAEMEQVELAADPAMVAPLGLLEPEQVLVEVLLVGPGGAVDALKLRVLGVAPPIGAGDAHQLERLAEMARSTADAARRRGRRNRPGGRG